jgi:hypothetical protein
MVAKVSAVRSNLFGLKEVKNLHRENSGKVEG